MAIKETYKIETNISKHIITGQGGIFKQEDYDDHEQKYLSDKDKTNRFILIDLWQLGVFGSENVNQKWNEKEQLNIVTEEDINKFTEDTINFINTGLFSEIKEAIIDEIKADEEETIKLVR